MTEPAKSSAQTPPQPQKFHCGGKLIEIRDVWADNLEEEMENVRRLAASYHYVAMDTEFPGVVAKPLRAVSQSDYHYQTLRCNVNLLNIIQLGITFANDDGQLADDCPTWQFNFKFDLKEDMHAPDSIDLLVRSGIEFRNHEERGINVHAFGELLTSSGLVLNEDIKWISFHSGYDFGYLLKLLTNAEMPSDESQFYELLRLYFPLVYDVKHLMSSCDSLKGGLNKLAEDLDVERVGPMHQAGSDSLLTASTFFKLRKVFFDDKIDDGKYLGVLFGISPSGPGPNAA